MALIKQTETSQSSDKDKHKRMKDNVNLYKDWVLIPVKKRQSTSCSKNDN